MSKRPKDPNAPKKYQSAFFIFSNERRAILLSQTPNQQITEKIKLIAAEWAAMTKSDRQPFKQQENEQKKQYLIAVEEYKKTDKYKEHQTKLKIWKQTQKEKRIKKKKNNEDETDTDSSTSSSSSKHIDDVIMRNKNTDGLDSECQTILDQIHKIFKQKQNDPEMLKKFNNKLLSLANGQEFILNDNDWRKEAKHNLLQRLERYGYTHSRITEENEKTKIYKLIDEIVIDLRHYKHSEEWEQDHGNQIHYSCEVALKSTEPHEEYKQFIHTVFEKLFDVNIRSIICAYSHSGFRWYEFTNHQEETASGDDCSGFEELNGYGIMFEIPYNLCGAKSHSEKKLVKLERLKRQLKVKELNEMTEKEMSVLMMIICDCSMGLWLDIVENASCFQELHGVKSGN